MTGMNRAADGAAEHAQFDPDAALPPSRALTPAVTRLNEARVGRDFWPKVRKVAGRIPFAADVVSIYYCARDPETPTSAKAMMMAALAYFVLPADAIPDILAGVGFSDDAAVIAAVIALLGRNLKPRHKQAAKSFLARLARDA